MNKNKFCLVIEGVSIIYRNLVKFQVFDGVVQLQICKTVFYVESYNRFSRQG